MIASETCKTLTDDNDHRTSKRQGFPRSGHSQLSSFPQANDVSLNIIWGGKSSLKECFQIDGVEE
jgi:hypothetical protein